MFMCSLKTMVKILFGIGALLLGAYVVLPEFRPAIVAIAPVLLLLACPLAMLTMGGMNDREKEKSTRPDDK
jgi:predicted exporter